ncbi:DUF192 domain-containing protein [Bordetella avium]|uniref:Exported protein n=1 Tax=Bordetella avium (strain 197N) TaxID=360910 RepID=Q2KZH8_BORA1|nr:DUF192 domain-containing protein [Bordetella avium]AZY50925.1 DUF192 domain-containing protein [Bordetella avium]AZY54321.1 DUF192 domain-containing protein [Bordetella avium]RIQ12105.1 DUF192 domain-containing protein [Bordetella avium]RIQ19076.1 DUF192 domain-containing protein [Bordetella avium]RIQ31986.1 DUF192 domain-containing protein [Bordetella avium]
MQNFSARLAAWAVLSLTASLAMAQQGPHQNTLPTTQLSTGIHVIQAEVAHTEQERQVGLMNRTELPGNSGMLFVFEAPDVQCFWMRNTPLPLSIAFIADNGTITNIEDMAPQTDDAHCSRKPVRYALEMSQGWFAQRGVKAGSKIDGLP